MSIKPLPDNRWRSSNVLVLISSTKKNDQSPGSFHRFHSSGSYMCITYLLICLPKVTEVDILPLVILPPLSTTLIIIPPKRHKVQYITLYETFNTGS